MNSMVDMKLPKKSAKEQEKGIATVGSPQEEYPYGLQISLENEQLSKLTGSEGYEVGDTVNIMAVGTVTSKSANDRQDGRKDRRLTIQIKRLSCNKGSKMAGTSMKEQEMMYKKKG